MSDTPRTDAATIKATAKCLDYSCTDFKPMVPVEVSKQIESENAALRAELEWIHWNCMDFAHDAVTTCRICRLLNSTPK